MTSQPGLLWLGLLHTSLETMATAKSDERNDCKDELIQEKASDNSSDDSSSVESEFDEEFEGANAWRLFSLDLGRLP